MRTHLNPSPASKGAADKGAVEVDVSFVLEGGQKYRLMDPRQVWGEPVATGTVKGKSITAPVSGDLAGYVVLADQARTDSRSGR